MSETPVSGNDEDPLLDGLVAFTACIGSSLEDVCSYSLTIGETYIPFDPDEDDMEEEACQSAEDGYVCSQAWVRVMSVLPKSTPSFATGDCAATLVLTLEVGIRRCFDIPEGGEAPSATDVLAAALQAMDDMRTIYCAAMSCEAVENLWASIDSGTWTPHGPLGGEYGGVWTFDVEIA